MITKLLMYCMYVAPVFAVGISDGTNGSYIPIATSLIIVLISTHGILIPVDVPFSLQKIFWIFTYIMLGIVPIITYKYRIEFWDAGPFLSSDYSIANIVIIISLIIFIFFYKVSNNTRWSNEGRINYKLKRYSFSANAGFLLVSISVIVCVYVYYLNGFDFVNVWTRGKLGNRDGVIQLGQIHYLFLNFFLIPLLSINLLLYGMMEYRSKKVIFILAFILLFTAPPTSIPRFAAAAMYIPLFLWYLKFISREYIFSLSLIAGLLIIFPLLQIFRYPLSDLSDISFSILFFSMFTDGHLDSYQSLMMILKDGTVTYGLQLVGVLLFMVPRDIWPEKPIGSGHFMAEKLELSFNNISANYIAEGYINFGFTGVIIFVIVLAIFCGRADKLWKKRRLIASPRSMAIYLILLPLFFFTLRGDLMSSFSFICGYIFAVFIVDKIIRLFSKVISQAV